MTNENLELLPVGFDLGNGFCDLTIMGKTASLVSGYTNKQPGKVTSKRGYLTRDNMFSVTSKGETLYFGKDVLADDLPPTREIDKAKYYDKYIQAMFSASVALWQAKYGDKLEINVFDYRLSVVTGMPPELYKDVSYRNKVKNAYKRALRNEKKGSQPEKPWYVSSQDLFKTDKGKRLYLKFLNVAPETTSYIELGNVRAANKGYCLVGDMGQGTFDVVIFKDGKALDTKSFQLGMTGFYSKLNEANKNLAEYEHLTGRHDSRYVGQYIGFLKSKLQDVSRVLPFEVPTLVLIGGATNLIDNDMKSQFKALFDYTTFLNGDCNSKAFAQIAATLLKEGE